MAIPWTTWDKWFWLASDTCRCPLHSVWAFPTSISFSEISVMVSTFDAFGQVAFVLGNVLKSGDHLFQCPYDAEGDGIEKCTYRCSL
jgi:hypothetical protein